MKELNHFGLAQSFMIKGFLMFAGGVEIEHKMIFDLNTLFKDLHVLYTLDGLSCHDSKKNGYNFNYNSVSCTSSYTPFDTLK